MSYLRTALSVPARPWFRQAAARPCLRWLNRVSCAVEWTPLMERAANRIVPWKAFRRWRKKSLDDLENQSRRYDIPFSELQIEFRWLVEDTLAAVRKKGSLDWMDVDRSMTSAEVDVLDVEECLMRLTTEELQELWTERLTDRVPIQYLTHTSHWRDIVLTIGPGVLIPRPETEQLIELAEHAIQYNPDLLQQPWADIGTGSGALAIALGRLLEQSNGTVLATDSSSSCLSCARRNVKRYGLEERIRLMQGEWYAPLHEWKAQLGGIVSNPPYIPSNQLAALQPEVRKHEPHLALDGGTDGMESLKILAEGSSQFLIPKGVLLLETNGQKQSQSVKALLEARTHSTSHPWFTDVQIHQDLFGVHRFVTAIKC